MIFEMSLQQTAQLGMALQARRSGLKADEGRGSPRQFGHRQASSFPDKIRHCIQFRRSHRDKLPAIINDTCTKAHPELLKVVHTMTKSTPDAATTPSAWLCELPYRSGVLQPTVCGCARLLPGKHHTNVNPRYTVERPITSHILRCNF